MPMPLQIAVLGSTRGTGLQSILDGVRVRQLPVHIQLVVSNKKDALILEKARNSHVQAFFADPNGKKRESYDRSMVDLLKMYQLDAIFLIGYMRILSPEFVAAYPGRIYNVHPSLLPAFAGGMDLDVHRQVLQAGVKETGCTIHLVDEGVDTGRIVLQKRCTVLSDDTSESLKQRVQTLEGEAWLELLEQLIDKKYE